MSLNAHRQVADINVCVVRQITEPRRSVIAYDMQSLVAYPNVVRL